MGLIPVIESSVKDNFIKLTSDTKPQTTNNTNGTNGTNNTHNTTLSPSLTSELSHLTELFSVSTSKLRQITTHFQESLSAGLSSPNSTIPMNPTWVTSFPTGHETGTILTLDLGGTNLRICKVTLLPPKSAHSLTQEKYSLTPEIKTSNAETLWSFCAECIEKFISGDAELKEYTAEKPIPFGFTFSYPATQNRIDHGVLQRWTKGFEIAGVEGEDAAAQLRSAIAALHLPVKLVALVNDTVGAMIASAYTNPATIIGAIFGTGCNAAYMAPVSSIPKLTKEYPELDGEGRMAINCEYGAFDNEGKVLPRTEFDREIDRRSPKPGEQAFEKMSAGLYLGEIFRLVLVDLKDRGVLFRTAADSSLGSSPTPKKGEDGGVEIKDLNTPYCIDTAVLSDIENDDSKGQSKTIELLQSTFSLSILEEEALFLKEVAVLIALRGARLCACGIAAICRLTNTTEGDVAADGSVANKHPTFGERWKAALGEILDWGEEEGKIRLQAAEDGSGVGAGVIVAMEMELQKEKGRS